MDNIFSGIRIALFDLDGSLVETAIDFHLMRTEVVLLARDYGLDVTAPPDILAGVAALRDQLLNHGREEDAHRFRAEAFAILQEIEEKQCSAPVEIPGAGDLLRALEERKVAVGIVTRNCRPVSENLLRWAGLQCQCLLTRDDVPKTKPDPSHLLAAAHALRVLPEFGKRGDHRISPAAPRAMVTYPVTCLMVGDHVMDIQAGRAAGMRTVGLLRRKSPSHFESCMPDLLVEGPADLLMMLKEL